VMCVRGVGVNSCVGDSGGDLLCVGKSGGDLL
jgi:hypothetical protein